jgi:hypothetical protein
MHLWWRPLSIRFFEIIKKAMFWWGSKMNFMLLTTFYIIVIGAYHFIFKLRKKPNVGWYQIDKKIKPSVPY